MKVVIEMGESSSPSAQRSLHLTIIGCLVRTVVRERRFTRDEIVSFVRYVLDEDPSTLPYVSLVVEGGRAG
jgi:hypothetical protein